VLTVGLAAKSPLSQKNAAGCSCQLVYKQNQEREQLRSEKQQSSKAAAPTSVPLVFGFRLELHILG